MADKHNELTNSEIHRPFRWIVADATARAAITTNPDGSAITAADGLYCTLLQVDTQQEFVVTAVSPLTFARVGGDIIDYGDAIAVTAATTITSSGVGKHHICYGTSADYTVALPTSGLASGNVISFAMANGLTKLVTLDAGSGVDIDGQQTRIMWAGETALLRWDGSNWSKVSGKSLAMSACLRNSFIQTIPTNTATKLTLDTIVGNVGQMADTENSKIIIRREGMYLCGFGQGFAAVPNSGVMQVTPKRNGATVTFSEYYVSSGSYPIKTLSLSLPCAATDYFELYCIHYLGSDATTVSGNSMPLMSMSEILQW